MKTSARVYYLLIILAFIFSCSGNSQKDIREKSKMEILDAEKNFAALCRKEGICNSFVAYAHPEATILAGDNLLRGIEQIKNHYGAEKYKNASLEWTPDFVDASETGDLGYTYGHYVYSVKDSTGAVKEFKGIFHTVWKKYKGEWKFVWDS